MVELPLLFLQILQPTSFSNQAACLLIEKLKGRGGAKR
jgi:hypothetical protein